MNPMLVPHEILPFHLATPLACLAALALVAAWVGVHLWRRRATALWAKGALLAAGPLVGFVASLVVMEAAQRWLVFATEWPLWPIAILGAVVVEALLLLYALERRVVPRRVGHALAALRVAIALLVVAILAKPVRSVESWRSLQRYVAVLLDASASMHVPDKGMAPGERVRLAERLLGGVPARPWRLERTAKALRDAREKLAVQVEWLASLREASPDARQKQLEARRRATRESLAAVQQAVAEQTNALAQPLAGKIPLDPRATASLTSLKDSLATEVHDRVAQGAEMMAEARLPSVARDPEPLIELLRRASEALAKLEPKVVAAGEALDEALYTSLSPEERAKIDAVASRGRFGLARELLFGAARGQGSQKARRGLLHDLQARYGVRLYTFAAKPTEIGLDEGPNDSNEEAQAAALPPEQQETNLAAALEKVMTDLPADRLAGVLLLTDGQHNAPAAVEPIARRFAMAPIRQTLGPPEAPEIESFGGVPICPIVFGGGVKPTTDAAIVGLEAPEAVFSKDKMYIHADLKLDGLAGKTVRVTLYDRDQPVDSEEVRVEGDKLRTRVRLADEPKETGLHAYRVKIEEIEGEVLTSNNERSLSVGVTQDQTKLLLVEGRPRWEFRYLKNLFASRDRTVKLQYVVLRPDEIPGQPPRPKVHASAARPKESPEATALPENEAEWMKFDVIILGDVEPAALRDPDLQALKRFVEDRAGTLIVIAGPRYMPHAYGNTPLAELLPVTFKAEEKPDAYAASPEERFHVELTPEGRDHVVTQLKVDPDDKLPDENLKVWKSLPDIRWRHPGTTAKEGAMVLAYAMPPTRPDFLAPKGEQEAPDEKTLEQRRQFVRERALIAVHQAALGRVMFLSTDHTWRLRYRVGDTHHHRFWGQVLRWATSEKLAAGTSLVKIGTDRPRYTGHTPVRVRAKITQADFTPVVSDDVAAVVYAGDKPVLRKKMDYVPKSQGLYTADLGQLDGGTYRVELEAPAAQPLLASEGADKVSTEFFVEPSIPAEQVELSANRGLLERVASLTGGRVADPAQADDALAALNPAVLIQRQQPWQWEIWNSWPLLVLIVLLAGAEWLLRKRARLA